MRLALQISGEMRTLSFCYPMLKKYILDPLGSENVDIFLHTWYRESGGEPAGHGEAIHLFKPRSYLLDKYEDCTFLHELPRSMTMFYSIWRANQARKEYERLMDVSYTLVVRYRTDCYFLEEPFAGFETYIPESIPLLVIPKTKRIALSDGPAEDTNVLCDWFAFGSPYCMDIYCNTYATWHQMGIYPIPESMIYLQLRMNGITEETWLKRPALDYFLIETNGKIRGLDECVKQESKNS